MDMRIPTKKIVFDGRELEITCNMNVLCDIQEEYGGDLKALLEDKNTIRTMLSFLTAMVNDALDSQGSNKRYTKRQVGRRLPASTKAINMLTEDVLDLVTKSLECELGEAQEGTEKN